MSPPVSWKFFWKICSGRRRQKISVKIACVITFVLFLYLNTDIIIVIVRDFIYLIRPIWDKPLPTPTKVIPHYYLPNIRIVEQCKLHHWEPRNPPGSSINVKLPKIIDAFIFSIELDLLEIRLKELWDVVDLFIIVEGNETFSGVTKPLYFQENMKRFQWAKPKILYRALTKLPILRSSESPFKIESAMRYALGNIIRWESGTENGDLVIVSDVDEIPSKATIQLIKNCKGFPSIFHLELKNFLYSFEFPTKTYNFKPHIVEFNENNFHYTHVFVSEFVLANSGWHCSFCFRYLSQFIFKMKSYSHYDRVRFSSQLEPNEIQRKICNGLDIFDMFPEAYTFKELISFSGPLEKRPEMYLPEFLILNQNQFKFLLPNGCIRESENI